MPEITPSVTVPPLHGRVLKACGMILAYGSAIGCVWFLCAAYRAGVLSWPI
jgi:hypothetical protein